MKTRPGISTALIPVAHQFVSFLSWEDILNYRTADKKSCAIAKTGVQGPYLNSAMFIIATTGLFVKKESKPAFQKNLCDAACRAYALPLDNKDNLHPVMFYKLRDFYEYSPESKKCIERFANVKAEKAMESFARGENMKANGRQYSTANHTWVGNALWVLGLIHAQKSIWLLSKLTNDTIYRLHSPTKYSALTKEIGALYQARSHWLTGITDNGYLQFSPQYFLEEKDNVAHRARVQQLRFEDINPTDEQCAEALEALELANWFLLNAQSATIYFREYYVTLDKMEHADLQKQKINIDRWVENRLDIFCHLNENKIFQSQHITNEYYLCVYFVSEFIKQVQLDAADAIALWSFPTGITMDAIKIKMKTMLLNKIELLLSQPENSPQSTPFLSSSSFSPFPALPEVDKLKILSDPEPELDPWENKPLTILSLFRSRGCIAPPSSPVLDPETTPQNAF